MTLRDGCHRGLSHVQLQSHWPPTQHMPSHSSMNSSWHQDHIQSTLVYAAVEGKNKPLGLDSAWGIDGVLSGEDLANGKQ